jgi:hypothetical protein
MTDKPTPTDAELKSMWQLHAADIGGIFCYARAVLAKWGQPAQAEDPVAWLRNTTDPQPHAVTNLKYRSAVDAQAGVEYIPVFAAHQPVAREPLTDEQVSHVIELFSCGDGKGHDVHGIARTIEAEVRKQDDALILQLVEAMEGVKALNMGGELALWTAEFDRLLSAITAGRARLEGKP